MTQAFKIEAGIRIFFLMAGIFLMLYGCLEITHFWMVLVGAIIILLVPVKFYRNYENRIYENPKTDAGVWRVMSQDQLDELIQLIEPKSQMHIGGSKGYRTTGVGLFVVLFLSVWSSGLAAVFLTSTGLPLTIPATIIFAFYAWFRLRGYGSIVPHPLSIQMNALQVFRYLQLPSQFTKKFEAQIVNDVNGDPDILNVRMDVRAKDPILGLLCLRLTVDRTKVQGYTYPFPYLVLVFGGDGVYCSSHLNDEIRAAVPYPFRIETSLSDGNSVFVILPATGKYTLDAAGNTQLANILYNLCSVCEQNRSEIEAISKMPVA